MDIDKKFIVKIQGQEFIKYEGLLDLAHKMGLKKIKTKIIQIPTKENNQTCIVHATAITEDEKEFDGIGDGDDTNINHKVLKHKIRMVETRAKARALRDLTNTGMAAIEEIDTDDIKEEPPNEGNRELSEGQIKRLYAIGYSKGIDNKTIKSQVKKKFNKDVENLTRKEYDTVCKGYSELKG